MVFQVVSFPQVSLQNPVCTLPLPIHATRPAHLLVGLSPEYYLVRSTAHKAPRYVVFSTSLLPLPSLTQTSEIWLSRTQIWGTLHENLSTSVSIITGNVK